MPQAFSFIDKAHEKMLRQDCFSQAYWNLLVPTLVHGLVFLRREGKYASPIFETFSWLVDDPEIKTFEELNWRLHCASKQDVEGQQATLNGILQAVLVTQHASIDTRTKLEEVSLKMDAVTSTATTSAVEISACRREIQELKTVVQELQTNSLRSSAPIGSDGSSDSVVRSVHTTELHSTSVDAEHTTPTSKISIATGLSQAQSLGRQTHTRDQRYVDFGDILVFSNAKKFVPTLQELDSTQAGSHGRGARETIAWLYGMRPFNGHPQLVWPTPDMVLKHFGTAHAWASRVNESGGKLSKSSVALLVNRFNTLQAIADFIVETCPQHYRAFNGSPDYQNALHYANDMDIVRGSASFNSWWDRVRVNRSCFHSASELLRILPAAKSMFPSLSEYNMQDISEKANKALDASKSGKDGFGESHLLDGRQKFAASDYLFEIEKILNPDAGSKKGLSSIKLLISKKSRAGYIACYFVLFSFLISILGL